MVLEAGFVLEEGRLLEGGSRLLEEIVGAIEGKVKKNNMLSVTFERNIMPFYIILQ